MRAVSVMARFTFLQLLLLADDAGRLVVYSTLARRLFPGDAEAVALLPGWLDELEGQRCIERYTVEGWPYLRIVNWDRHQKIYHPTPSRLPPRPAGFAKASGTIRESLGSDIKKPSGDKALTPAAQLPERFREPRESLGKKSASPCAAGLFGGFRDRFARRRAFSTRGGGRPTRPGALEPVRCPYSTLTPVYSIICFQ